MIFTVNRFSKITRYSQEHTIYY